MPLPLRPTLAAAAGVAAAVSFEPYGVSLLLPAAVAGVTLLVRGLAPRAALLVGSLFGTTFMLGLLPWLQVIGVDAWVALSVLEGLFYGLLGVATVVAMRLPAWPVAVAALWVGVEMLRGTVPFGGFPWGRLAFAVVDTPVANLMAYVGPAGATFVVALLGTTLAWTATAVRRTPLPALAATAAAGALALSGALLSPGPDLSATDTLEQGTVRVAAVQGDVPGEGMNPFSERRRVLENHVGATLDLAEQVAGGAPRPDLVIWPESSTDIDPFRDASAYADIQSAVDAIGVPVLVGAMVGDDDPTKVHNQGIVWEPGAGPGRRYSKTHPVPFGEYIPFRDLIARFFSRMDQVPRDMVPGTEPGVFDLGGTTIGDVICFEVAYDQVVRDVAGEGVQLLVVQTNNASYMGTGQIEQQFAIARLRAIETGRYVVVAATNGVSGILAPDGSVVERAPVRSRHVLQETVPLLDDVTAGVRWGPAVELVLVLFAGLSLIAGLAVNYRRRRRLDPAQVEQWTGKAPTAGEA